MRIAEAMMSLKTRRGCDDEGGQAEVAAARRLCGLATAFAPGEEERRKIQLRPSFCASKDSFDCLLDRSFRRFCELEAVRRAADAPVVVDGATGDVQSGGPGSWDALAQSCFTLALDAFLRRSSALADPRLAEQVNWALTLPRAPPALRSWPSKKALATLRATWDGLVPAERMELTMLAGGLMWFVQACDLAVCMRIIRNFSEADLRGKACGELLDSGRRSVRLDALVGVLEPRELMHLTADFVADSGCVDHLLRHAVQQATVKDELLRVATSSSEQHMRAAQQLPLLVLLRWEDVARVAFTLILAAVIDRCELRERFQARHAQASAVGVQRETEKRRKKRAGQRGRRKLAAEAAGATENRNGFEAVESDAEEAEAEPPTVEGEVQRPISEAAEGTAADDEEAGAADEAEAMADDGAGAHDEAMAEAKADDEHADAGAGAGGEDDASAGADGEDDAGAGAGGEDEAGAGAGGEDDAGSGADGEDEAGAGADGEDEAGTGADGEDEAEAEGVNKVEIRFDGDNAETESERKQRGGSRSDETEAAEVDGTNEPSPAKRGEQPEVTPEEDDAPLLMTKPLQLRVFQGEWTVRKTFIFVEEELVPTDCRRRCRSAEP